MQLLIIADDDSLLGKLDASSPDVLVSLGDLNDVAIQRAIKRYRPRTTLAVRGNHDADCDYPAGVIDLHLDVHTVGGIRFGGFGGSWRYKPRGHHLFDQEEVSGLMRGFPAVDVFIAHNSPCGIHQRNDEVHQGFFAFLEYIQRTSPRLFLHGHQHVNRTTMIGSTTVTGVFGECVIDLADVAGSL